MPYKDPEVHKQKCRERYQKNKHLWKHPDGTWKEQDPARRREVRRKYYAEHPEFREKLARKKKAYQDARRVIAECPICNETTQLVIDHCRKTNNFRARICSSCNLMLGFAYDTPAILEAAAEYLRIFEEQWTQLEKKMMPGKIASI